MKGSLLWILAFFILLLASKSYGQSIHGEKILAAKHPLASVDKYCSSFHFNAEVKNLIGWLVPVECVNYVRKYIYSGSYAEDSKGAIDSALGYVRSLKNVSHPKKAWVFDIDETSLSNIPYYAAHEWGSTKFNATPFNAWVETFKASALESTLSLYNELVQGKWKVIFLTGRPESQRQVTEKNLRAARYKSWEKLLLKNGSSWPSAQAYKSSARENLEAEGYEIWGNVGDQWSDISGSATGKRVFKLPNPLYFIP